MIPGPKSSSFFERAEKKIPGGVNSPVRAFKSVGGTPIVLHRGEGAHVEDLDGNRFLDFVGSWGPLILGHAHPYVVEAVMEAVSRGMSFGAPCRAELDLAERVVDAYPGIEQVRFVSSGTEATMTALRLARGITGRDLVLKFAGCYHGHGDPLLVAAGSGLVTLGMPSSAGVPEDVASLTRVLPLDDEDRLRDLFHKEGERIAAVIIEPIPANNGLLVQREEFLRALRAETERTGTLLIFDEVISGFRVHRGGAAARFGITPDLATFGKVIGGGMPVGALAGTSERLAHLAPLGPVYQAGTLSGNPVAMAAGVATLDVLERENGWDRLEDLGEKLESLLSPVLEQSSIPARLARMGSLFWMSLQGGELPRAAEAIDSRAAEVYRALFHGLLRRGIALAPSAYEVGFLSLAHDENDLERLASALAEVMNEAAAGV